MIEIILMFIGCGFLWAFMCWASKHTEDEEGFECPYEKDEQDSKGE